MAPAILAALACTVFVVSFVILEGLAVNNTTVIGVCIAFGTVVGTVIFAMTQQPVWIGVDVALGAGIGPAASQYSGRM